MKKWLFLILLFPLICVAQTYRYLGVEDGLSNRRVYCIQKDKTGYMWFLTHEGIDRYNGKEFKRYKLMDGDAEVNSLLNLNWLYIDQEGVLWEIGKKGKVFRYDQIHDCFSLVYKLPMESFSEQPDPVTYAWLDQNKHIWLCNKDTIFLYNTDTKQVTHIKNDISEEITDIEQIDESHFFIGTEMGIHYAQLENNALKLINCDKLESVKAQVSDLHFDKKIRKLFIGTFLRGIMVYDMNTKSVIRPDYNLKDISITRFKPLNDKELLIATDGGGVHKINMDTYQNALLRLTTNLINFERADVYSSELYISEHELNTFMNEIFNAFQQYANIKHINFTYESNFRYMNVWFDKEKMESIFKNIISNALKYTPENGNVQVFVSETTDSWSVEVRDTGIGIPANEQKKLFKLHFRGSNAINSKVTGSGIGLMLVWKLVRLHKGKINLSSIENQGSVIKITFPKDSKRFRKAHLATPSKQRIEIENVPSSSPEIYENAQKKENINHRRILIVEDNDELRNYLSQTLSEEYFVQVCSNGKEALTIIPEYKPELVISDIMMPEMRGDELCQAIKNNIETSHIPVILLTALNNEKDILSGLQIGADEYVVKPFNIGILKANVANLLANRALLRSKFANLDLNDEENDEDCINCSQDIDWKFIANVKKNVEDNIDNPALTVDVLCSLMGMSRTSFYNKLRALTDQAPGDYIRLIRLKRAVQLLKEDTHSITEIAEMTGFSDAKYFREVFKKHYNVSPSQYGKEKKAVSKEGGEKKE